MTKAENILGTIRTLGEGTILETTGIKVNMIKVTETSLRSGSHDRGRNGDSDGRERSRRNRSFIGTHQRVKEILWDLPF